MESSGEMPPSPVPRMSMRMLYHEDTRNLAFAGLWDPSWGTADIHVLGSFGCTGSSYMLPEKPREVESCKIK